jgi:hypothetical protein
MSRDESGYDGTPLANCQQPRTGNEKPEGVQDNNRQRKDNE